MKKVLVIGAAGTIGTLTIKYLLSEGKYEVTALDLKNKKVVKRLHRYNKRVNIIYGDLLNRELIENLVKENDFIINLATCLPPLAEYKNNLSNIIECDGNENIIRAINFYNPKCHLIYASSTSLYNKGNSSSKDKIVLNEFDFFDKAKYEAEKFIQKKGTNYTIVRLPLILGDLRHDPFIYSIKLNEEVEVLTKEDAAYAIVKCIDNVKVLNKKIINIGGGDNCRIKFKDLLVKILKYHGLNWRFINTRIFTACNYDSNTLMDSDKTNDLLKYRNDSIESYFMRQKRRSSKRKLSKLLGKVVIKCFIK